MSAYSGLPVVIVVFGEPCLGSLQGVVVEILVLFINHGGGGDGGGCCESEGRRLGRFGCCLSRNSQAYRYEVQECPDFRIEMKSAKELTRGKIPMA